MLTACGLPGAEIARRPSRLPRFVVRALSVGLALAAPATALAHHEAIFGPQSSLVLSAPAFVSLQTFSKQIGVWSDRTQETTSLVSGAVTPFSFPLSFSLIVPVSYVAALDGPASQIATEDITVGARYRLDLEPLNRATASDGNFLMGMAAAELPTGSMDHRAFHGPVDGMFALLGSLERRPYGAIAYGFYRANGLDADAKKGDSLTVGGGASWTPIDGAQLLSFQLGFSFERYARNVSAGAEVAASGGDELLLHPTIVWGREPLLVFAMMSIPVYREMRDPLAQDRWRAGLGLTYLFGR